MPAGTPADRAVGGQTFAGGRSNAIAALQNPVAARQALIAARQRQMGGGTNGLAAPTQQQLYANDGSPSYTFGGGGGGRDHNGGGVGTGDPNLSLDNTPRGARIGNAPGTFSSASPMSSAASDFGGLSKFHQGQFEDDALKGSGLSRNPSAWDRQNWESQMDKSGQFDAKTVGQNYLNARQSGNPNAIVNALGTINNFRNLRSQLQGNGPTPLASGADAPGHSWNTPAMQPVAGGGHSWDLPAIRGTNNAGFSNTLPPISQDAPKDRAAYQPNSNPFSGGPWNGEALPSSSVASNPFANAPALPAQPDIGHMAMGGHPAPSSPYMVGEKGDELAVGDDGRAQLVGVNGPEIGNFSEPGTVIPHNKLPEALQRVQRPMSQSMRNQIQHREMGGTVGGGSSIGAQIAPFVGSGRGPSGMPMFGQSSPNSIFTQGYNPATGTSRSGAGLGYLAEGGRFQVNPQDNPRAFLQNVNHRDGGGPFAPKVQAPDLPSSGWGRVLHNINPMNWMGNPLEGQRTPTGDEGLVDAIAGAAPSLGPNPNAPSFARKHPGAPPSISPVERTQQGTLSESMDDAMYAGATPVEPTMPDNPFSSTPWNGQPYNASSSPFAPLSNDMTGPVPLQDQVLPRVAPLGFTALSPRAAPVQSFQTPYGKASVSFGQNQPHTFEGLPADEYFQRAANRPLGENKFATAEPEYRKGLQSYYANAARMNRQEALAKERR